MLPVVLRPPLTLAPPLESSCGTALAVYTNGVLSMCHYALSLEPNDACPVEELVVRLPLCASKPPPRPSKPALDADGLCFRASQNLRRQAEVISKQERLFAPRPANWLSWEDANRARVAAVEKLNACTDGAQRPKLIRDCLVLAFHTLQPPDRVGVVVRALLAPCLRLACRPVRTHPRGCR